MCTIMYLLKLEVVVSASPIFVPHYPTMAGVGRGGNASVGTGVEATKTMHLSKPLPFPTWCDQAPQVLLVEFL